MRRSWEALESLARDAADLPPVLVGLPEPNPSDEGRPLVQQRACCCAAAASEQRFRKALLPTYDVFDEDRYFEPFHGAQLLDIAGTRIGISICEDIWNDRDFWKRRRYHHDPIEELAAAGASVVVNMSASPFTAGKHRRREEMLGSMALQASPCRSRYVNQFGGNDDLVFDGRSSVFGADGAVDRRAAARSTPTSWSAIVDGRDADRAGGRSRRGIGDLARARARHARLRAQVRLLERRARPVRRHRLGADRGDRGRRARRRSRARRADAVAVFRAAAASTMRMRWRRTSASRR